MVLDADGFAIQEWDFGHVVVEDRVGLSFLDPGWVNGGSVFDRVADERLPAFSISSAFALLPFLLVVNVVIGGLDLVTSSSVSVSVTLSLVWIVNFVNNLLDQEWELRGKGVGKHDLADFVVVVHDPEVYVVYRFG